MYLIKKFQVWVRSGEFPHSKWILFLTRTCSQDHSNLKHRTKVLIPPDLTTSVTERVTAVCLFDQVLVVKIFCVDSSSLSRLSGSPVPTFFVVRRVPTGFRSPSSDLGRQVECVEGLHVGHGCRPSDRLETSTTRFGVPVHSYLPRPISTNERGVPDPSILE